VDYPEVPFRLRRQVVYDAEDDQWNAEQNPYGFEKFSDEGTVRF